MSEKKPVIIPEKIHLQSINIFQANLQTSEDFREAPKPLQGVEFGIAHEIAHNFEDQRSRFRLFFSMEGMGKDQEPEGVKVEYGIEFHFWVENFRDFLVESKEDEPMMDVTLPATLLGMAYSTARGIIFERTRGTYFDGIVLPVVDPFKVLKEGQANG